LSISFLVKAEIKPLAKQTARDTPSAASSSHTTQKNKNMTVTGDNSGENITKSTSTIKEQGKELGNPGWPSKIENPVVMPSTSSQLVKG
jgi:hypothetical protein